MIGNIKKFITEKLYGWKENTDNNPIRKGIIYKTNKRLFKNFSSITWYNLNNSTQFDAFFYRHFLFCDHVRANEQDRVPTIYQIVI